MKNVLLQKEIAKKAFLGDCLRKPRETSAFITISVNAKIQKNQRKNLFLAALGAPKDFKIFD